MNLSIIISDIRCNNFNHLLRVGGVLEVTLVLITISTNIKEENKKK